MPLKIARIAVEQTAYSFDKAFDYYIPVELREKALPGCRVLIPFGKGNRKRQGMIMELIEDNDLEVTKPILAVLDKAPLLNSEMLELAKWIKEKYFCTLFDAIKPMLPTGLNLRIVTAYTASETVTDNDIDKLEPVEKQLMHYLLQSKATVERDRLLEILGLDDDTDIPDKLAKQGYLIRTDDSVRKVGDAVQKMVRIAQDHEISEVLKNCTKKQTSVINFLLEAGTATVKEICYFTGVTTAVLTALEKKGIIEYTYYETFRNPNKGKNITNTNDIILTDEQQKAYNNLYSQYLSQDGSVSLLYGITGSGKTQVFMKLVEAVYKEGKQVIVMVPEIALTPQTLSHFISRFGETVAVLHSGLSLGERLDEWKRIKTGKAKIVIGTRSAIFAPCDNLGLIIIDEEQEHTYKSEGTPRFHARDIARFRVAKHKGLLLLASATPSIESFYNAKTGKYSLNKLSERYGKAQLPEIQIIDLRNEIIGENIISSSLGEIIEENLLNKHQSILLHNRRGHNTYVSCRSCGYVFTCPNCSISMTYHSANGMLMCHMCGHITPMPEFCPECESKHVRYSGFGTQRIEKELSECFPEARILRLDADTITTKYSYENKLGEFAQGHYDIMIGTQMVAKGLDFPNVTLVGVLLADQIMYGNDFRSFEKAFSMLTQVVGRSGRGNIKGKAVIQTFTPENPLIELAAKQDYEEFYNNEITTRKIMLYPPYCDICMIGFVGINHEQVRDGALCFLKLFTDMASREYSDLPLRVLGPSPAIVPKVCNNYRYRIIVKCRDNTRFRNLISILIKDFSRIRDFKDVTAYVDMNPETTI